MDRGRNLRMAAATAVLGVAIAVLRMAAATAVLGVAVAVPAEGANLLDPVITLTPTSALPGSTVIISGTGVTEPSQGDCLVEVAGVVIPDATCAILGDQIIGSFVVPDLDPSFVTVAVCWIVCQSFDDVARSWRTETKLEVTAPTTATVSSSTVEVPPGSTLPTTVESAPVEPGGGTSQIHWPEVLVVGSVGAMAGTAGLVWWWSRGRTRRQVRWVREHVETQLVAARPWRHDVEPADPRSPDIRVALISHRGDQRTSIEEGPE